MKKKITYPCIYALSAGMGFGPIAIPEPHCLSEKASIDYALGLMKTHIKNRAVIRWDEKGNKKVTQLWRSKNGIV
jgi:hypothetical protein